MKRIILIIVGLIFLHINVNGQMTVSDPIVSAQLQTLSSTAYAQYVETVNSVAIVKDQLMTAKENLDQAKAMKGTIGTAFNDMKKVYNNTFGLLGELNELYKEAIATPAYIEKLMGQYKDIMECAMDDMKSYQKAEKAFEARFIFDKKKPEDQVEGPPTVGEFISGGYIDRYEGKYYSAGVESLEALDQDPCAFTLDAYALQERIADEQKKVITDIIAKNSLTQDEIDKRVQRMDAIIAKVESTPDEKETLDTTKQLSFLAWQELTKIGDLLSDIVYLQYTNAYEGTVEKLQNMPRITDEQRARDKANGVRYNKATRLSKWMGDVSKKKNRRSGAQASPLPSPR